jgi:S1-C subfamily serine protease
VYDFRREEKKSAGQWGLDDVWVYPSPQNVGLTLSPRKGNRVQSVADDSPAQHAGLQVGDELQSINGESIASFADAQHALHHAPSRGKVAMTWQRGGKTMTASLELADGWRKSDISWRTSMWGLDPAPNVHGPNLTPDEKKSLGLAEKALAFRQAQFVPPPVAKVGIRAGDIIVSIDGKTLEMTMLQFNAYVRLNYKVGDQVKLNIIRNGQRLEVPITLAGRPAS